MQHSSERHNFNNRRGQQSYRNRHNVNQELPSSRPGNGNYHNRSYRGGRNSYGLVYGDDSSRRVYRNTSYGSRQVPYDKRQTYYYRNSMNKSDSFCPDDRYSQPSTSYASPETDFPLVSPEEVKVQNFIRVVQSQSGIGSTLVLLQTDRDNAISVIQNAVNSIKNGGLAILPGATPLNYELIINGELIVEGEFVNKQAAKNVLCELALDILKKTCFFIIKKENYEEISTEELDKTQENTPSSSSMEGSKAHQMMLKMGWGGKGLGVNEQGAETTVAETMTRNVTKEGLGGKNVMSEINNILEQFARSTKLTTLAFNSGFTKEERACIHNLAAKFNLRSKSEGKGENRRITIGKKMAKWDLIKELLLCNCENEAYKLIIPSDFKSIWSGQ